MSKVNFDSTSSVSFGELGPTTSLQLMFAKLQLELAETAKTQAKDKMDAIAKAQDEQKLVSQLLNEARQSKANAKNKNSEDITTTYYKYDKDGKITGSYTETAPKGKNYNPMSSIW